MRLVGLLSCVAIAFFALACSNRSSPRSPVDSEIRTLIWPQATILAGADLRALKKTSLYQRYADRLNLAILDESSEKLGVDPRQDFDSLALQSDGSRFLVMANGRFHLDRLMQKLNALQSLKRTEYRSYTLLGDERNSLALLKGNVAIAGSGSAVRSAIDVSQAGKVQIPVELESRLRSLSNGDQVWIVSRQGLPLLGLPMRSDVQSALSNIVAYVSGTTAGLQIDNGLKLEATLDCVSIAGAKRVHDALRGGIGLARLTTKDDQTDLLGIYDAIDVTQAENAVNVKASLSSSEFGKLISFLAQIREKAGALSPR